MKVKIEKVNRAFVGTTSGALSTFEPVERAKTINMDGSVTTWPVSALEFTARSDARLIPGATLEVEGRITLPFTRTGQFPTSPKIRIDTISG